MNLINNQKNITYCGEGERIDTFIANNCIEITRSQVQKFITLGLIKVNGSNVKKNYILKNCDNITILIKPIDQNINFDDCPLIDVIFQNEDIIIVNKPINISVHRSVSEKNATVVDCLIHQKFNLFDSGDKNRPGIIHRLDKNTTGILVIAKTFKAFHSIKKQFENRSVIKIYIAICHGNVGNGQINSHIHRSKKNRKTFCISKVHGRLSSTLYKTVFFDPAKNISLVALKLITGRTHQARVHMAGLNHPIIGDVVYGVKSINDKYKIYRQLLHAYYISFEYDDKKIEFMAEIPDDIINIISCNKKDYIKHEMQDAIEYLLKL